MQDKGWYCSWGCWTFVNIVRARCGHNLMQHAHKVSNHHLTTFNTLDTYGVVITLWALLTKCQTGITLQTWLSKFMTMDVLVRLGNRLNCTGKKRNSQEKLQVGNDIVLVAYAFLHCSAASSNLQQMYNWWMLQKLLRNCHQFILPSQFSCSHNNCVTSNITSIMLVAKLEEQSKHSFLSAGSFPSNIWEFIDYCSASKAKTIPIW
jgi:hypothetical protein